MKTREFIVLILIIVLIAICFAGCTAVRTITSNSKVVKGNDTTLISNTFTENYKANYKKL